MFPGAHVRAGTPASSRRSFRTRSNAQPVQFVYGKHFPRLSDPHIEIPDPNFSMGAPRSLVRLGRHFEIMNKPLLRRILGISLFHGTRSAAGVYCKIRPRALRSVTNCGLMPVERD